jgi:hypothetical protein
MWRATSGLALALVSVAACATAPSGSAPVLAPAVGAPRELPPQILAQGDCASFFWTADAEHRFLVFEHETGGFARLVVDGAEHRLLVPPREAAHVTGDPFRRVYSDPERQVDVRLSGIVGDPLPEGRRMERVVMRVSRPDSSTLVIPMIGHYACRPAVPGAQ